MAPQSADSALALRFISIASEGWKNIKWRSNILNLNRQSELHAVRHLCQLQYWQRLWIVQENVMAKESIIQCGFDSITWDEFTKFQMAMEWERIPTPPRMIFILHRVHYFGFKNLMFLHLGIVVFSLCICYKGGQRKVLQTFGILKHSFLGYKSGSRI
jgi:hypothetical protein